MDRNHKVQIGVQVNDKATDPLKRISNEVKNFSGGLRTSGTSLGAFNSNLDRMITKMDRLANSMYRFNMYSAGTMRVMRNIGMIGVGAGVGLGVQSANRAMDFEYLTTKMQTRMETSKSVRDDINKYILDVLNPQVSFKPSEIAELGIQLGQGGVNTAADMKSLLKTTTYFSEAVDAVPAEAGEMLIAAAKGFDISINDANQITDKLTVALNKSLLQVEEMPHAIGELAGRAKMLGQSFDSSLTALMMGRDQGMSAAQTAQDFLHGLRQLSLIGREDVLFPRRKQYYEKLGVDTSFFDTEKKQLKEFPEIIASLEKTMAKQGMMPNREEFYKRIQENGGKLPDDIINKMSAMPLISRVFGAAGQAPILMGLQAKYEEVNNETGVKTGRTYYGSEALKKMQADLEHSTGAVNKVHQEMAQTAKFQLEVLAGAWEAAQIKIADDFLPLIKVTANELTKLATGQSTAGGFERISKSIDDSVSNLKKTQPELAKVIGAIAQATVDSAAIATTTIPTFKQAGNAYNQNIVQGDWGDSLLGLPYHAVMNGFGFIGDVVKGNKEADDAISKLPPELQDQAKLTRGLIQGGLVLAASGAIIKILEMAIRTASLAMKGTKAGMSLGKAIIDVLMGSTKTKGLGNLNNTMAVNANIVNVYGKVVNGGGGPGGGMPDGPTVFPSRKDRKPLPPRNTKPTPLQKLGRFGPAAATAAILGYSLYSGSNYDSLKEQNNGAMPRNAAVAGNDVYLSKLNDVSTKADISASNSKATSEQISALGDFLKSDAVNRGPKVFSKDDIGMKDNLVINSLLKSVNESNSAITSSLGNVDKKLENVKVDNKLNIQINPFFNVSGELKNLLSLQANTQSVNYTQTGSYSKYMDLQNRRLDGRY